MKPSPKKKHRTADLIEHARLVAHYHVVHAIDYGLRAGLAAAIADPELSPKEVEGVLNYFCPRIRGMRNDIETARIGADIDLASQRVEIPANWFSRRFIK